MEVSEGWMANVTFPATKLELIDAAVDGSAPQEAVERLQALRAEQYATAEELERELAPSE